MRTLVALAMFSCVSLTAASVDAQLAIPGAPGTPGVAGGDGGRGGDGRDGAPVRTGRDDQVLVRSFGGDGGVGGDGSPPNGSGGDGGDGGDGEGVAIAIRPSGVARATATVNGGRGGDGGRAASGGDGGGGNGGDGGDARADARAESAVAGVSARAESRAGAGGNAFGQGARAGDGGSALGTIEASGVRVATTVISRGGSGGDGRFGADAGSGGSVAQGLDSIDATISSEPGTSKTLRESITAVAGSGGDSEGGIAGRGGDATVERSANAANATSSILEYASHGGTGGDALGGGLAGDGGIGRVFGESTLEGAVRIEVEATGGNAGGALGSGATQAEGGTAESEARAVSLESGASARAVAEASGGRGSAAYGVGRRGGLGAGASAIAHATATPTSSAEAEVVVRGGHGGFGTAGADGGDGASVTVEDVVAAVGANVELVQHALGGAGGYVIEEDGLIGTGGRGGDAVSRLDAANAAGDLMVEVSAEGGRGGSRGAMASPGDAHVEAIGIARDDVEVAARAMGGRGGGSSRGQQSTTEGGSASLGRVYGRSTGGGIVDVSAVMIGGEGGSGPVRAGNGRSVEVVDAVDGDTSGSLALQQRAVGGDAGEVIDSRDPGSGAAGGDALNSLRVEKDVDRLGTRLDVSGGRSSGRDVDGRGRVGGEAIGLLSTINRGGDAVVTFGAFGGEGADTSHGTGVAGDGGDAKLEIRGETFGDDHDLVLGEAHGAGATGGRGGRDSHGVPAIPTDSTGGNGGDASIDAEGVAHGNSQVEITATSRAGAGGRAQIGGSGGHARSVARGKSAGDGGVSIFAGAHGGGAGESRLDGVGGDGGTAEATAFGESSGGGTVSVSATATGGTSYFGTGGSVRLENAVAGKTAGSLNLRQSAAGGRGRYGRGGDAESSLVVRDEDGGDLSLNVTALGAEGLVAGGDALADAVGIGVDDVSIYAAASAGRAGDPAGVAGRARFGRVYGESLDGGSVDVQAVLENDVRGVGSIVPGESSVLDAELDNVVDGRTTGDLELDQRVEASPTLGHSDGRDVVGGRARNRLVRKVSSRRLDVGLGAVGGSGLSARSETESLGAGGAAEIETRLFNKGGSVALSAVASGGEGGGGTQSRAGAAGGSALLNVDVTVEDDGHSLSIGRRFAYVGARGGDARSGPVGSVRGEGGKARSRSVGWASGNSRVIVNDSAQGGFGSVGGDAFSFAKGRNAGEEDVVVFSQARAGGNSEPGFRTGRASAEAIGESKTGRVSVEAFAIAGRQSSIQTMEQSVGEARAQAIGGSVDVLASAEGVTAALGQKARRVVGTAFARGGSDMTALARSGASDPSLALDTAEDVAVFVSGAHRRESEWGRAAFSASPRESGPDIILGGTVEFPGYYLPERFEGVFISFLDVDLDDNDFERLTFRLYEGSRVMLDSTFEDAATAAVFFGAAIDLETVQGPTWNGRRWDRADLRIEWFVEGVSKAADIGLEIAVGWAVVPQPSTGALLALGLIVLSSRRPRR